MKVIKVNPTKIAFGKDLPMASSELIEALEAIFGDSLLPFCLSVPPIFVNDGGSLILVDRHYSFALLVEQPNTVNIPGILVSIEEHNSFAEANKISERVIVAHAEAIRKEAEKNASGVSRRERKDLGYTCPFCGLLLKGPHGHKPQADGKFKGYFRISCFSAKTKKVPCGFQAFLSVEEYALFRQRKYPVHLWLKRTESQCPKCGKSLFLRIRFSRKLLMCEDNFRAGGKCKYYSEQPAGAS